jgi:NADH dehydrogenase
VEEGRHRVVVVGGGFGGLQAVKKLRRLPVDVTLVDRRNFHLFQPLLYQVATGGLSPGEIATPLRGIFKRADNVRVVLAEVSGFDLERRLVLLDWLADGSVDGGLEYDTLIVAAGSRYSYFGHDEWRQLAPDVKTLESALEVRRRILLAFEAAELETDPELRAEWLTFVVVGAGPTGVELAGQIAEIAGDTLRRNFRAMNPREARILLVEAADRVLTAFPPTLSARAQRSLLRLGVTPLVDHLVVELDERSVTVEQAGARERIPARTVVWAAGVAASPLARALAEAAGEEPVRGGRVVVEADLTLPGHPEVLVIGDMAEVRGTPDLPVGVAPVAMQEGRYAARVVHDRLEHIHPPPFRYLDKGSLATIGRARAVADIKGLHVGGFLAWLMWLVLHLFYLVGFQNRVLVLIRWATGFLTRGRGARLITGAGSPGV